MPPEELRPAHGGDYILTGISLLLAGLLTVPVAAALWDSLTTGELSMVALLAMTWNALVWLIPLTRGLLNWRVAVLAGIHDHSYLLRLFWQTQLLLIVIVTALILPFVVLIRIVCGAFPLL